MNMLNIDIIWIWIAFSIALSFVLSLRNIYMKKTIVETVAYWILIFITRCILWMFLPGLLPGILLFVFTEPKQQFIVFKNFIIGNV